MSSRRPRIVITAALAAIFVLLPLAGKLKEAHAAGRAGEQTTKLDAATTTEKDQTDLSVTVYNSNVALVRDVRQIHLQRGVFPLWFEDVAASIMPATVHFRSLTDPAKLNVVEQNYEYDLLDPQKLLQKYVGRELTVMHTEVGGDSTKWVAEKALLLADNNGGTVWKIGDKIVTNAQVYSFPDLPGNLYSRPTLVWTLDNRGADAQKVEASYLTNNMNWSADYVLNVGRDEKTADLDGWVTLVNNSGAAYDNAKLQLVAGEVHRTQQQFVAEREALVKSMAAPAAAPQFQQEGFSEYHLYTLQRGTSIQNNESKQISLLNGTNIPVEKYLAVEGQQYYYRNPQGIGNAVPQPVKVFYRFKNDEKSGLGMPLPAGTVRVYQADSKGGVQFAGEDTISHTPKDETLRIYVGNAFDVVCERKQMDYKKLASNLYEMEYQITLRNHKDGPVTVEVREPVGGDWEVVDSNYKWTKLDATTIGFEIPVDKDGASTLDYRVRVKW
ncbi:MAG: DUF4139 domain-containing protein [Candidatus Acidiferrales bacterium]|jgi:hypothetical protein